MLKLTQEQVADRLGVTTASVYNWESDDSKPSVPYIPAVVEFLGYDPLPHATTCQGGWSGTAYRAIPRGRAR